MMLKWAMWPRTCSLYADCYLIDDPERNSAEKDAASPIEQAPLLPDENKGSESE